MRPSPDARRFARPARSFGSDPRPQSGAPFLGSWIVIAGLVGFNLGCDAPRGESSPRPAEAAETAKTPEPRKVEGVPCRLGMVRDTLTVSTNLESLHTIDVPARVAGRVAEVAVREGDAVRAGDVILSLEADELSLAVRERELEHRDAVERASTSQLDWEEAGHSEEVSRLAFEKALRDFNRQERLLSESERRAVSEEEIETSRFNRDQARLQHESAQLATRRMDLARKLADLMVDRTQVAWERARLELERATIRAPIDGDVTDLDLRPGEQVVSGARVVTVVDRSVLYCTVRIPQRRISELAIGLPVEIESETHPGRLFHGRLEAILPVVDPDEGTVEARVAVEDLEGVLRPGAFLSARLVLSERDDATLVPKRARLFEGNRSLIFVVRDGKAERIEVRTGLLTDDEVEILPGPGAPTVGEIVVVRGQSRLRHGDPVTLFGAGSGPEVEQGQPVPASAAGEASPTAEDAPQG